MVAINSHFHYLLYPFIFLSNTYNIMNITVTDTKVTICWLGKTRVSEVEELVDLFKNADEFTRRTLAPCYFESKLFKTVSTEQRSRKPVSTLTLLSECCKQVTRFNNCDYDEDIDDLLGVDPYLPLY